jgi:hypothetical protein
MRRSIFAAAWLSDLLLYPDQKPLPPAPSPERSMAALLLQLARAAGKQELQNSNSQALRFLPPTKAAER